MPYGNWLFLALTSVFSLLVHNSEHWQRATGQRSVNTAQAAPVPVGGSPCHAAESPMLHARAALQLS
jgi:hypothetical protein